MAPIAPWLAAGVSEPITDVHVMAKLRNRIRRFLAVGRPIALGIVAVGDAHTCTNPLYGRGCSLAMVQAELLADAVAEHATVDESFHLGFEAATAEAIEPWYQASVSQDRMHRAEAARQKAELEGGPPTSDDDDPEAQPRLFMRSVLREGLFPALRTDPAVFRAFLRGFNLLASPEALLQDSEVMASVLKAWQSRDEREPEPPLGPNRDELLALLDNVPRA